MKDARKLRAENEGLRQQLNAVQAYFDTAEVQEQQIQKLRGMLNLNTVGRARVNADIINYVPYDNRITLNRGSRDGVKPNYPVITAEGLLALVSTVSETTSQASLLTSSGVSVGGVATLPTPVAGFVKGEKSDRLVMDVFDNVDIPVGTEIITTGYSEFIPRGIRIGIVSEYFNDQEYGIRRAFILPSSRIGMSKEVVILK
ncbi:MAG: rod shape-determining protein MreC [Fimbriimonadaceae bacterium]|nr:MAG: rod shape-determining protein MreC [Fimbriimonadaceae bacterium]